MYAFIHGSSGLLCFCVNDVIGCCIGLPGAPPVPLLEVINVTKVMVRLQSPNDTGRLNISHYHVSVSIHLYVCPCVCAMGPFFVCLVCLGVCPWCV